MSLKTVQPSHGLHKPSNVAKTSGGENSPSAPGDGTIANTVHLSDQGKMLSKLSAFTPPTRENVRQLSASLAGDLENLFRPSVIDTRRDIGFEVDSSTGKVTINDHRADAREIAALIESQPDIERQIRDIATLSRHVAASEVTARAQQTTQLAQEAAHMSAVVAEYASRGSDENEPPEFSLIPNRRAAGNKAEISRIMAEYAAFSGGSSESTSISVLLNVNGADISVNVNGKPWTSSRA